ncbi:DICT sensory domain-containing protein [Nocardioides bruguierae]|uniref:DICT sensory domain-containing protein n=1 Tax=Nocardioides bruguierae TaxID=2945102 RepID=UPI0027E04F98|nr:DICT sensory domain-containing protein [Nocardioides bruguierae]
MNTTLRSAQAAPWSIGDLAERTGVSPATLRMWEARHGFPMAVRLDGGHRRYTDADVAAVRRVLARRDAGQRLDAAVAAEQATSPTQAAAPVSLWAHLRERHPALAPQRLTKATLLGLSWAIEDEALAVAGQGGHLVGLFQRDRHYRSAAARWRDLAGGTASCFALGAGLSGAEAEAAGPDLAGLTDASPLRREWAVVHDHPRLPMVLTAWEPPGQADRPDRERVFETLWSVEPAVVRDAARLTLGALASPGTGVQEVSPAAADRARAAAQALASPAAPDVDVTAVTRLFNRVLSYVDRTARHRPLD